MKEVDKLREWILYIKIDINRHIINNSVLHVYRPTYYFHLYKFIVI